MIDGLRGLRGGAPAPKTPAAALAAFLVEQLNDPARARALLAAAERFQARPPEAQAEELPALYLLFEQYLTELAPHPPLSREALRRHLRLRFADVLEDPGFQLVFEAPGRQEVLLCRDLLRDVLARALPLLEGGTTPLCEIDAWLAGAPDAATTPVPLGLADRLPADDAAWTVLLRRLAHLLYRHLESHLPEAAPALYDAAYATLARRYESLDTFTAVIHLLPEHLLDERRLQRLRHSRQLQAREQALEATQGALRTAESAALESVGQLQAVLDAVGDAILTFDEQGLVVLANREVEQIWGYPRHEVLGRPFTVLLPLPVRTTHPQAVTKGMAPFLGRRVEFESRRSDGSPFPIEIYVQATPIGPRRLFTAAARDITSRKRFEAELIVAKEEAEEMARTKAAFFTNMSHEIRTPLTAILGYAAILADEVPEAQLDFVRIIEDNSQRLLQTLNAVLDLARFEAGQLQPTLGPADVSAEVAQAVRLFEPLARQKNLALHLDAPALPVHAVTDVAFLHRILSNLIGNAVKFTEEGEVTVALKAEARRFHLGVTDTGAGIDPAFMPYLFDEFRQESAGLTRSHEGAGLGLAITHRLVDALGGTIDVQSRKGRGSRFTVSLPRRHAAGAPARRRPVAETGDGFRGSALQTNGAA